jgi:hypothetical protein
MDFDIVSDLNGGDATISANEGDTGAHGKDAVSVNRGASREAPASVEKVGKPVGDGEPPAKALSLRDQISSALKGEEGTPAVASQDGKVRNPDGTFAAKPAVDPAAPAVYPAAPVTDPAAAAPVAVPAGIKPEVFQSLPAETQAQLARTMDDIAQSQQRFARLDQVEQLISPRRDAWALNGMTDAQALNQLLALSDFATKDAAGFIQYFAQNNGVKLEDLVFQAEPVDPTTKALQDRITQLESAKEQETLQQRQAAHTQTVESVTAFATEAGQDGKPLRPYFADLGDEIMPLITAVKSKNPSWTHTQVLQEAYDRACWGTPSIRAKMQAAADAAGEAQRLRDAAAKVEAARSASASVRSGAPTGTPAAPNDAGRSLRDTIRASIAATS